MQLTEHETRFIKVVIAALITAIITYMIDVYYETHHLGR